MTGEMMDELHEVIACTYGDGGALDDAFFEGGVVELQDDAGDASGGDEEIGTGAKDVDWEVAIWVMGEDL